MQALATLMSSRRVLSLTAGLLTALLAFAWWLSAAGHALPKTVHRLLFVAWALALLGYLGRLAVRLWRDTLLEGGAGRWLLGLAVLSFVVSFVGLGHELGGLYFADEGTFVAQAQRTNGGQLLRPWFVYPHLLFYLDAFALWVASLLGPVVPALAKRLYGIEGELAVAALVARSVTATLGAATVVPAFLLGRKIDREAPLASALTGGLLAALCPIFVEVAHLGISDVPAAFFATLALALTARLLDTETARDYALAGAAAGLAAGSKYPTGLVAFAIAALWLRWRLRGRASGATWRGAGRFGWAVSAALLAFLATTPSLLPFGKTALFGESGVLFGARLYAEHGWPGVVRASNLGFYGAELLHGFGLPALLFGLLGWLAVRRETLARLAWMLPFPALYLVLILSMKIALRRNLMPVLPALAVLLAIGGVALVLRLGARLPRLRRVAAATLALVALALPAYRSAGQLLRASTTTTRDEAARWIGANIPPGATFIQEHYTPQLSPPYRFFSRTPRLVSKLDPTVLRDPDYDFVLLASEAYGRFFRPDAGPDLAVPRAKYQAIFDGFPLVRSWQPGPRRSGPELRLYRLDPVSPAFTREAHFTAAQALLADDGMRTPGTEAVTHFSLEQWSLFRAYLAEGRYRVNVTVEGGAAGGVLRAVTRDKTEVARAELAADGSAMLELPTSEKYFLYVYLPPGTKLRGVRIGSVNADTPAP